MRRVSIRASFIALLIGGASALTGQQPVTSANGGTVAGVVRDTLGRPMPRAEVSIPDASLSTRADAEGRFIIADVASGDHVVWVRSLGFAAAQFQWEATKGGRIDIAVRMLPLPTTLNAVNVYAEEEKGMKSRSAISGVIVDTSGFPLEGVEVQLIGAMRKTYTNEKGEFAFRNAAWGDLTVRARQMGYAPATKNVTLQQNDDRKVYLKMHSLAQTLDAVQVTAESGYGPHQDAWRELDQRLRFRGHSIGSSKVLGPEKLADAGKEPIDLLIHEVAGGSYNTISIRVDATQPKKKPIVEGDACILLNGWRPMRWPLRSFGAEQLDMLEYYPAVPPGPETEHTYTVAWRFNDVPGCEYEGMGTHPAYYVLWLKGSKDK